MTRLVIRTVTTAYASDLGLKPGEWPMEIEFEGWKWTSPIIQRMGDQLLHVSYTCSGRKLVVIND